jgi:hypothetical protein
MLRAFAADEGFVHFDFAGQLISEALGEGEPQAMIHKPRRLLGDSQVAGRFARTDAILAIHHQPQGREPFVQAQGGILENGSGLQGEGRAGMARVALPNASFGKVGELLGPAAGAAHYAIRPPQFHHDLAAILEIAEVEDCLLKCLYAVHGSSVRFFLGYVKYINA